MHSHLYPQVAILVLALVAVTFIFTRIRSFIIRYQFARSHGCQPVTRSSNKDPFLGLDDIRTNLRAAQEHRDLENSCEAYSLRKNTFTSRVLLRRAIFTIEPENIKTILSTNFKDFGIGYRLPLFEPLLGKGIFDTDGDHWAASRALIRPNFTRDQVADLSSFENLIPDLFALIPFNGETVDLQGLFFRYTINSATEFLFGQSVSSLRMNQSELGFAHAFNYAQEAITTRGLLGPFRAFYRDKKADECNHFCREFAKQFVEGAVDAVQSGEKDAGNMEAKRRKYIFSHELAARTSDKRRILDELMNVLLAGRDTTASLLSNMFFMLAKHPDIWAKLRREVASLDGRVPTYEELRNLKYVRCCMNECESFHVTYTDPINQPALRLHPVVPQNEREALNDTILPVGGGEDCLSPIFVAKGTLIGYNVFALHRRKDIYGPDADEFRPERWEDPHLRPRWEYLPFNGGPRICVGQQYALTEVGYVTVRMAQEFSVLESRDPGPWEESLTLTLCSRYGTRVAVRRA